MPALDAHTPTSQSAWTSACSSRTAYGAPEAPVMPRKIRTGPDGPLLGALGSVEEDGDLVDLRLRELVAESRHDLVAELARVGHVLLEEADALAADRRQVRRAVVR